MVALMRLFISMPSNMFVKISLLWDIFASNTTFIWFLHTVYLNIIIIIFLLWENLVIMSALIRHLISMYANMLINISFYDKPDSHTALTLFFFLVCMQLCLRFQFGLNTCHNKFTPYVNSYVFGSFSVRNTCKKTF